MAINAPTQTPEQRIRQLEVRLAKTKARLSKTQAKLSKTETKLGRTEVKLVKAEANLADARKDLQQERRKNEKLFTTMDLGNRAVTVLLALVLYAYKDNKKVLFEDETEMLRFLGRMLNSVAEIPSLDALLETHATAIREGLARVNVLKPKQPGQKPETVKLINKIAKRDRQIKSNERKIGQADDLIVDLVATETSGNEQFDQTARKITDAYTQSKIAEAAKANLNTHGRIAVPQLTQTDNTVCSPDREPALCPKCGKPMGLIDNIELQIAVRSVNQVLDKFAINCQSVYTMFRCNCGHVHLNTQGMDVPVTPTRSMSQRFVISAAYMAANGTPLERIYKLLDCQRLQIGSSTLNENIDALYNKGGLKFLVQAIEQRAQSAPFIIADGTPLRILQQEGCAQRIAMLNASGEIETLDRNDIEGQNKLLADGGKKMPKSPYLEVITSRPGDDKPFAIYKRMLSRSAESIQAVLGSYQAEAITTDGYGGYDAFIGNRPHATAHQCCLTHFLREIMVAIPSDDYEELGQSPSGLEVLKLKYKDQAPDLQLNLCAKAIRLVFYEEAKLKRQPHESEPQWLERIRQGRLESRTWMNAVDDLMQNMAPQAAQRKGGGWVTRSGQAWAKAVVYYLNQREKLRAFLDEPRLTIDSNAAERVVRPFAVLRSSAGCRQSCESVDVLLGYLTLFETAAAAGIKHPTHWLEEFAHAYFSYCADEILTKRLHEGLDLSRVFDFPTTMMQGFCLEQWLPWVYAKSDRNV